MNTRKNIRVKTVRHDPERDSQVLVRLIKARAAATVLARGESPEGNIVMQVGVLDPLIEAINLLGSDEALGLERALVNSMPGLSSDVLRSKAQS